MAQVAIATLVAGGRAGRVISFPTDTVPALAALPQYRGKIYQIKQRSPDKPLILMAATLEELWPFVDQDHPALGEWQRMAKAWLPGALTLVLPQNPHYPPLNPNFNSIGIRVPAHRGAIALLRQTSPLLTTSANRSSEPPLTNMAEIAQKFPEVLVWANQPTEVARHLPSTVLAWEEDNWVVKRQGALEVGTKP